MNRKLNDPIIKGIRYDIVNGKLFFRVKLPNGKWYLYEGIPASIYGKQGE